MKDLKEFIFENYYKEIGFTEKDSYHSLGRVKKKLLFATKLILDPTKAREHYELF